MQLNLQNFAYEIGIGGLREPQNHKEVITVYQQKFNGYRIRAEVGMIVRDNVYTPTSTHMLIPKGTRITHHILHKLALHGVMYIYAEGVENRLLVEGSMLAPSVLQTSGFKKFSEKYKVIKDRLNLEFENIAQGQRPNLESFHENVVLMTEQVSTRSELLNYLRYIKQGDDATFAHSLNVGILCYLFGTWMKMTEESTYLLLKAGILHDIGKTKIPLSILYKPSKLTDKEFELVKKHPIHGYAMLDNAFIPREVKMAALMHHEKLDCSGYPLKRDRDGINIYSAIVAICDIYEAMTADRIYRAKVNPFHVIHQFETGAFGALKEEYIPFFVKNIAESFINNKCILSDGREAVIVLLNPQRLSKPLVHCEATEEFIDLSKHSDVSIINIW